MVVSSWKMFFKSRHAYVRIVLLCTNYINPAKLCKNSAKIFIFLELVQWVFCLSFAKISITPPKIRSHGSKEEYCRLLVTVFRLCRRPRSSRYHPLRIPDAHPAFPRHFLREGNGYHVITCHPQI